MKKPVAIFFLSIYAFSFVEFHQFLRIPVLIEHFAEHRQLDPGMSFISFIKEHYVGEIVVDEDFHRDNELPFRQAQYCISTGTITYECPETAIEIASNTKDISRHFIFYIEDKHSLLSAADIFQPPRLA